VPSGELLSPPESTELHVAQNLLYDVRANRVFRGQERPGIVQPQGLAAVEVENDRAGVAAERHAIVQDACRFDVARYLCSNFGSFAMLAPPRGSRLSDSLPLLDRFQHLSCRNSGLLVSIPAGGY
jgi:hypothetical protein